MSAYRISIFRPAGWLRLGLSVAVAMVFVTPMVWSVGGFGHEADALNRAAIFLGCGTAMPILAGLMIGWSLRAFAVRVRENDDEADAVPHRPAAPPRPASPPAHGPAHAAAHR